MKEKAIFQMGVLSSLILGNYDGVITAADLKQYGDTGIGTFDAINGEMILLNGTMYQALGDGAVVEAEDSVLLPFANAAFFQPDCELADICAADQEALKKELDEASNYAGMNQFLLVKGQVHLQEITVRSEIRQEKPYRPLQPTMREAQRVFSYKDIAGDLVAICCPGYISTLNSPGWHFHFVSDDRKKGGHVLEMKQISGSLSLEIIRDFHLRVPDTELFRQMRLEQDVMEQIREIEG